MTSDTKGVPGSERTRFSASNQPTRRRGPSLTGAIKRRLKEVDPKTGRRVVEDLARSIIDAAGRGSGAAIREIFARLDGAVPSRIEGLEGAVAPVINFISTVPDADEDPQLVESALAELDTAGRAERRRLEFAALDDAGRAERRAMESRSQIKAPDEEE